MSSSKIEVKPVNNSYQSSQPAIKNDVSHPIEKIRPAKPSCDSSARNSVYNKQDQLQIKNQSLPQDYPVTNRSSRDVKQLSNTAARSQTRSQYPAHLAPDRNYQIQHSKSVPSLVSKNRERSQKYVISSDSDSDSAPSWISCYLFLDSGPVICSDSQI